MKIQVIGLGQFGEFLARLYLVDAGNNDVWGTDIDPLKKGLVESLGATWGQRPDPDVTLLCCFPKQYSREIIPATGLVVNLSSVQTPGIRRLVELGVLPERVVSFHPLFGPIGVKQTGWVGKKIIMTIPCLQWVVDPFIQKGVVLERMTPAEHDEKMLPHAVAFLVGQLIGVGFAGMDDRYLTGSARHALGLLEFVGGSGELTELILSNPALAGRWPAISGKLEELAKMFGWGGE